MRSTIFFLCLLLSSTFIAAQTELSKNNLKDHLEYLASDELEGRMTGSAGEELAAKYIAKQFKKLGLKPLDGLDGYYQPFDFTSELKLTDKNSFGVVDALDRHLNEKLQETWTPLSISGNGTYEGAFVDVGYGISAPDLHHEDYTDKEGLEGKCFVMEYAGPGGDNPHSKFAKHLDVRTKVELAIKHGAAAVVFINTDSTVNEPLRYLNPKSSPLPIPVIFRYKHRKLAKGSTIKLTVELEKLKGKSKNVAGFFDNGAEHTIVLGAHYDHLGYGTNGSLYKGEPDIHNGADDNASGVALLLELARYLGSGNLQKNNYVFIAFSGEELGLYGSNYFVKNAPFDLKKVNFMINLDMVGRLDPDTKKLAVNGVGSSPSIEELFKHMDTKPLEVKTTESGVGPSDHTSFYLKDIPVMHFFSGAHQDYHKPSDDVDKINYEGIQQIGRIIITSIQSLEKEGKLVFSKTSNEDNTNVPRFKVTLGVVPDYMFDGAGMRIDGVTDGRPASKAGLEVGDVVIQLGEYKVSDMMSYMRALSMFNKTDKTTVKIQRGEEVLDREITF